jgi:hypothetical protein
MQGQAARVLASDRQRRRESANPRAVGRVDLDDFIRAGVQQI